MRQKLCRLRSRDAQGSFHGGTRVTTRWLFFPALWSVEPRLPSMRMRHNNGLFSVMNIYVGNLSFTLTEEQLRDAFAAFGDVKSANIISDRETGRSKGFGFVEMPNASEATAAIEKLNGESLDGRPVRVNEARPRT
jgi:RNA recognition motif-containing protein